MVFCSQQYLFFFAAVFVLYWALPWRRARVWLLLAASFYFYACWNRWLALLICASTCADYWLARGIEASVAPRWRKAFLGASLAGNLGLLCYFKYANFFLRSLEEALRGAGADASLPVLQVILPVGISFYTFEAINYTVDVYRGHVRAQRSLPNFLLFILFFPHLVAGPIVRARDFLPQVERRKRWSWPRASLGVQLFVLGLFKKVIADRMATVADPVFAGSAAYGTGALWLAVLAYAVQVYCDFSGYSDMALGSAHLLGYKLAVNFDMPFLSANVAELWRRWHISLSTWLRDYVFFPLGGSRGTKWQAARNQLITFTLCGLWHGAAWPFVAWGALQGVLLVVHRQFRDFCGPRPRLRALLETRPGTAVRVGLTFLSFCLTLAIFRSPTVPAGLNMLGHMFTPHAGLEARRYGLWLIWLLLAAVALGHALGHRDRWQWLAARLPSPVRGLGLAAALGGALLLAPEAQQLFIYFVF